MFLYSSQEVLLPDPALIKQASA